MTKKWLYSVAMGVLLLAGKIFGITAPEVLDMNFNDYRHNAVDLREDTKYSAHLKKRKEIELENGWKQVLLKTIERSKPLYLAKWRSADTYIRANNADKTERTSTHIENFKYDKQGNHEKSKTTTVIAEQKNPSTGVEFYQLEQSTSYTSAGRGNPQGPLSIADNFDKTVKKLGGEVSKSEHKAATNMSASEVVIEGTIYKEGIVPVGAAYETAIFSQKYTKFITTKGYTIVMAQNSSAHMEIPREILDDNIAENIQIRVKKSGNYQVKSQVNYALTTTTIKTKEPGTAQFKRMRSHIDATTTTVSSSQTPVYPKLGDNTR